MELQIDKITNEQIDKQVTKSSSSFNSLSIQLPYSYVKEAVKLNWHDVLFAIETGYLSHLSAIEYAASELEENDSCSQEIIDLVSLSPDEAVYPQSIHPYIDELASFVSKNIKDKTPSKLMYVLLKWIFEQRDCYCDPLRVVEIIYDDFNFPQEMACFVRYMPMQQPDLGSQELNQKRLFNNWQDFLDKQQTIFAK